MDKVKTRNPVWATMESHISMLKNEADALFFLGLCSCPQESVIQMGDDAQSGYRTLPSILGPDLLGNR